MKCNTCGNEFPDGQNYCPSCGAPAQQPTQFQQPVGQAPMGQQPMGQPMYQQAPVQPAMKANTASNGIGGYFASLPSQPLKIASLVGALFILIAPFFSWFKIKVNFMGYKQSEHLNMFNMEKASFVFFGIILLLIGAALICWELADAIPALNNVKQSISNIPYIQLIILGVALLVVILAFMNGDIREAIKLSKVAGKGSHGAGPLIATLGIIANGVPVVMDTFVNKK